MKMQIIIVQSEIETAIRNLILSQLSVKEGMRIDIDLSATRGADGFKATIDIVPETAPSQPKAAPEAGSAPVPTPAAKPEVAVTKSATSSPATQQPPIDNAHIAEGAQKFPEPTGGAAAEAGAASNASAEPSSTEPVAAVAEGGEAKPARSLFAGLKKPANA
jgi:hypothetical protein